MTANSSPAQFITAGLVELFAEVRRTFPDYPLTTFRTAVARAVGMESRVAAAVLSDRTRRAGETEGGEETPVETLLPVVTAVGGGKKK